MHRLVATAMLVATLVGMEQRPAAAAARVICTPDGCFAIADVGPTDGDGSDGPEGGSGAGGRKGAVCAKPDGAYPGVVVRTPDGTVVIGATRCNGNAGPGYLPIVTAPPPPPPDGGDVARSALGAFPWVDPDVRFTPDIIGAPTKRFVVVHMPLYFAILPVEWHELHASATACNAGGCTTAAVTATPETLRFTPGDGGPVRACSGPGVIVATAAAYETANRDCSYTYDHASSAAARGDTYSASVGVEYSLRWSSTNGGPGTLPNETRSSSYGVRVGEVQAIATSR